MIGGLFSEIGARRGFLPLGHGTPVAGGRATASGGRVRRSIGLISRRIRDAFAAEAAEDPSGDYPPPSDCWPAGIVRGEVSFHSRNNDR